MKDRLKRFLRYSGVSMVVILNLVVTGMMFRVLGFIGNPIFIPWMLVALLFVAQCILDIVAVCRLKIFRLNSVVAKVFVGVETDII